MKKNPASSWLFTNRYRIFPAVKWQGHNTDHLALRLKKVQSHTSTPPVCHHGMLLGELYLILFYTYYNFPFLPSK